LLVFLIKADRQHNLEYFGCFISFCFTFHYSKSYFFGLGTTTLTSTSSARETRDPRAPSTTPPRPYIALGTIGSRGLSAPRAHLVLNILIILEELAQKRKRTYVDAFGNN
jgi:hypothetical protein